MYREYHVYILRCSDGTYYTGVTNNVDRRFAEHQDGHDTTCYTFERRPVELMLVESFTDVHQAIAREKQLKGWGQKKKEALIAGDMSALSWHALGYERRTFPPLSPEERKRPG